MTKGTNGAGRQLDHRDAATMSNELCEADRTKRSRFVGLDELIVSTAIEEVWYALGGPRLKNRRGPAFWRDGDDPNIRLTDRGFRDFVTGERGGILRLIELALRCSRREAALWLADFHGVALERTEPAIRRSLAERRRRAVDKARDLIEWRDRLILALRYVRNNAWDAANRLDLMTIGADPDDAATWEILAEAVERRRVGDAIDGYADDVMTMSAAALGALRATLEDESKATRRAA